MKRYVLFLLLISSILLSGCENATKKQFDKPTEQALDKYMTISMKKYSSPGMILGVWVPGKGGYLKAKGTSDITKNIPMDTKKIFRVGSLTKTYTGTVILQLVDEGKLGLDDKLSKYFSWIPNSKNITIRQLLNMTSGLYDYSVTDEFGKAFTEDRMKAFKPAELIKMGIKYAPDFAPGQGFHYSNTNTIVLGMIVNKVTNSTLENEIKRRIFDQLGLKHTYFPRDQKMPEQDFVHGYMLDNGKYEDWSIQNVSWGWAAGAIVSNINDLKTYITALGDGTFISKKLQAERFASGSSLPKGLLGKIGYKTLKYNMAAFSAGEFVGHNGGMPGYVDIAMYDPKNKAVIIIMLNVQPKGEATLELFRDVHNIIFPGKEI